MAIIPANYCVQRIQDCFIQCLPCLHDETLQFSSALQLLLTGKVLQIKVTLFVVVVMVESLLWLLSLYYYLINSSPPPPLVTKHYH